MAGVVVGKIVGVLRLNKVAVLGFGVLSAGVLSVIVSVLSVDMVFALIFGELSDGMVGALIVGVRSVVVVFVGSLVPSRPRSALPRRDALAYPVQGGEIARGRRLSLVVGILSVGMLHIVIGSVLACSTSVRGPCSM